MDGLFECMAHSDIKAFNLAEGELTRLHFELERTKPSSSLSNHGLLMLFHTLTQHLRRCLQHQPPHGALMDEERDGKRIGDSTGQEPGLEGAVQEA